MKSKAPLALMEQLVMVLVFALAAALCLQVFAFAQETSRRHEARDRAVTAAQTAAETLKACAGDFEEAAERLEGTWDGDVLTVTMGEGGYLLTAAEQTSGQALLGRAEITVTAPQGEVLFVLPAAWQEVSP